MRLSIADSGFARELLRQGYTYVQLLSGYLLPSPIADINRDFTRSGPIDIRADLANYSAAVLQSMEINEGQVTDLSHFYKQSFASLYLETSLLRILKSDIESQFLTGEQDPLGWSFPQRFLGAVDEMASITAMPEATFSIVHLMKPHKPVVFDGRGNMIDAIKHPSHDEYFAEFGFVNSKFLDMIDTILRGSRNPPIIIFQADHGTTYGEIWTDDERLTHFDVYAAYYLPERYSVDFPERYTTVNAFPLILNAVFGATYDILEDRLFDTPAGL